MPARPNTLSPSRDTRETKVRQHLDDPIRQYLDAVGGTPLLSAEEEVDLARRIEAGVYAAELLRQSDAGESTLSDERRAELERVAADGREAKDHMVRANLRLVVSVARRYAREVPLLEVVQEGNLGLIRAVEKFDYAKGFKFSTYATWWIRQAIQRALPELMRVVRLPVHVSEELSRMRRAERRLAQELDRDPTAEEVAAAVDSRVERIEELRDIETFLSNMRAPHPVRTLDIHHYGFSDFVIFNPQAQRADPTLGAALEAMFFTGTLDSLRAGQRALTQQRRFLAHFFDRYLETKHGGGDGAARSHQRR